jgi:peptide/nickel transport system substrate-binding protein
VDKTKIEQNPDLKLYERMSNTTEWLCMNMQKPPFDNILVRQAIAYAIDKEAVNIVATDGRGTVANDVISPNTFGHNFDLEAYPHDPEKAKELLAQAGFPDGFTTTLWANGEVRSRSSQVIQANLAEVGITVEVELLEWAAYLDRTAAGEHDMHILGWTNLSAEGDGGEYAIFHTDSWGATGNKAFYSNPKVDELLDKGRQETDDAKRPAYYTEANLIIHEEVPLIPLYNNVTALAARADLKGVHQHPLTFHTYYNLYY